MAKKKTKNDFVEGGKILLRGVRQIGKIATPAARATSKAGRHAFRRAADLKRQSE